MVAAFRLNDAITIAGHEHDIRVLIDLQDLVCHFDAGHNGHDDVRQDQTNLVTHIDEGFETRHAVLRDNGAQTRPRDRDGAGSEHDLFIVAD